MKARTVKKMAKAAEIKNAAAPVAEAAKEEVKKAPAEEVKEAVAVEKKEEAKEAAKEKEVKKAPAKRTTAKKTAAKEEEKAPVKKTTAKRAALKANVTLQFAEKSYTEEALVAIAKDVWKFDLKQKATDLKVVELYVKPEEGLCYYVFNGEITGSFVV